MITDLTCATLLQSQYDGAKVFDYQDRVDNVSFAVKLLDDCSVILFEGTYNLPDWLSNFQAEMIAVKGLGGVERGFYDGLPEVLALVKPKMQRNLPVYVTGHSRGAAHANIFAVMMLNEGFNQYLTRITFASPRCGDAEFNSRLLNISGYNYRNYHDEEHQDFVCDVPFHFNLCPYGRPEPTKLIDVPPAPNDPWLIFARHHLALYSSACAS